MEEKLNDYIDLAVAETAKQFGAIALDAVYLLAVHEFNKYLLTFEEVKMRTRASSELVVTWIKQGKLRAIKYPDQIEPLFDKVDVDRLVLQYVAPNNETIIKQIQKKEQEARNKLQ